jgi:sec-independent protein translocase protein TatB
VFDVGFWEITLIMLVVLVVVGPERLPKMARTVGVWTSRARRMVADVKAEVDREIRAQELKESMGANALKEVRSVADEMRAIGSELKSDVDAVAKTGAAADKADQLEKAKQPEKAKQSDEAPEIPQAASAETATASAEDKSRASDG